MAEEYAFSAVAGLGGLRPVVVDRFVATKAAIQVTGAPSPADRDRVLDEYVKHFTRWLKSESDPAEKELMRAVLLMVAKDRPATDAPARLVELVDKIYRDIG